MQKSSQTCTYSLSLGKRMTNVRNEFNPMVGMNPGTTFPSTCSQTVPTTEVITMDDSAITAIRGSHGSLFNFLVRIIRILQMMMVLGKTAWHIVKPYFSS